MFLCCCSVFVLIVLAQKLFWEKRIEKEKKIKKEKGETAPWNQATAQLTTPPRASSFPGPLARPTKRQAGLHAPFSSPCSASLWLTAGARMSATISFFLLESERDTTSSAEFNPGIRDSLPNVKTDPYIISSIARTPFLSNRAAET